MLNHRGGAAVVRRGCSEGGKKPSYERMGVLAPHSQRSGLLIGVPESQVLDPALL